jgi:hypothetical protein
MASRWAVPVLLCQTPGSPIRCSQAVRCCRMLLYEYWLVAQSGEVAIYQARFWKSRWGWQVLHVDTETQCRKQTRPDGRWRSR